MICGNPQLGWTTPDVLCMRRRLALCALLPLLVLVSCQKGITMWDACSTAPGTDPTGTDGTYVLVCRDGRWEPLMTNDEFIARSRGSDAPIAPLPQQTASPTSSTTTTTAAPPLGWASVAAGTAHTCALTTAGAVKCWGKNSYGQLGNGSDDYTSNVPVDVTGLNTGVTAIAAGDTFTCAVAAGAAKCWGINSRGQLGNGSDDYTSNVPVDVTGLNTGVTAIATGGNHACAVVNGATKCWGMNSYGQLGNGSDDYTSNVPVDVTGLDTGVTFIAAGDTFTCAVAAGAAKCWGINSYGQLGNGSDDYTSKVPVDVTGLNTGVTAIATGDTDDIDESSAHACAVVAGAARCWGRNSRGQLGNGSDDYTSNVPVDVTGLDTGVTAIATGADHSCAVASGAAWCWGFNGYGQLGNGSDDYTSNVPVNIPI